MNQQQYQNQPIPGSGKATAALVLGITSIVFGALPLGIIGIIMGLQSKKEASAAGLQNGTANAGFVLSIIGTIYGALWTAGIILYIVFIFWVVSYSFSEPFIYPL